MRDPERRTGIRAYLRVFDFLKFEVLRRLLLVFLLFALPFALYVSMFSLFADRQLHFTAEQTGYFLGFIGLLGIVWQGGAVGPMVKRFGERRALLIGLVCSALGIFSVVWANVWWKLGFVAFFFSFGNSIIRPSLTSLITRAAPPERRGGVLGATTSIESFSRIVAPVIGGWIIGGLHPNWLGWVGGLLFTMAAVVATTIHTSEPAFADPTRVTVPD